MNLDISPKHSKNAKRENTDLHITIVGAGLAGCEAAWQMAKRGIAVTLIEMKPHNRLPAYSSAEMGELVCSNSLRAAGRTTAVGLLKEELRIMGSLLISIADRTAVPAGRALAVDRILFSKLVEEAIAAHPLIKIERQFCEQIPEGPVIIATGPLTEGKLAESLSEYGALLAYHDAIAPLVSADSIDMTRVFTASRYDTSEDEGDYLNCPFDKEQYSAFIEALISSERTTLRNFESAPFFEGCLPVEELADRGFKTLAFGPMKPVGLTDPATGRRPYAVVQLRRENLSGSAFNIVGFQTRLTRSEQRRVFRMIPGLENVQFERYGQVHRNSFIDAPKVLDNRLRMKENSRIFIAGQLSGVEGYVESISSGMISALFAAAQLLDLPIEPPPLTTATGGLMHYLTVPQKNFQPSNVVWSMINTPSRERKEGKQAHRETAAEKAVADLNAWLSVLPI